MKKILLTAFFVGVCAFYVAAQPKQTSLNVSWLFALDPLKSGEKITWTSLYFPSKILDNVSVAQCYWYIKDEESTKRFSVRLKRNDA